MLEYVRGDTIESEITANTDITGWKIRAEFYDNNGQSVQLATENSGGSDDQISIDDVINGVFTINVDKGETTNFNNESFLEIEREDSNGKINTIFQGNVTFMDEKITWTSPTS